MITTSFFELFKIGRPSSSHTIGPMRAALEFREAVLDLLKDNPTGDYSLRVELYGALAATGHGHGTHRAVLAGLMGYTPTTVDTNELVGYFEEEGTVYTIDLNGLQLPFTEADIFFDYSPNPYRHPNTMRFVFSEGYTPVLQTVYYSVGGGFIEKEGATKQTAAQRTVPHAYNHMAELELLHEQLDMPIDQILLENEQAINGWDEATILSHIAEIMRVMHESVQRGLVAEGILPGGLNVSRRAKSMYQKAVQLEDQKRYGDSLFARTQCLRTRHFRRKCCRWLGCDGTYQRGSRHHPRRPRVFAQ